LHKVSFFNAFVNIAKRFFRVRTKKKFWNLII